MDYFRKQEVLTKSLLYAQAKNIYHIILYNL